MVPPVLLTSQTERDALGSWPCTILAHGRSNDHQLVYYVRYPRTWVVVADVPPAEQDANARRLGTSMEALGRSTEAAGSKAAGSEAAGNMPPGATINPIFRT